jgi:hypothetical protein
MPNITSFLSPKIRSQHNALIGVKVKMVLEIGARDVLEGYSVESSAVLNIPMCCVITSNVIVVLIAVRERHIRRRSGQRVSGSAPEEIDDKENIEDEVDGQPPNPKIEREIQELSKIPDSGAAKIILEQLKKKKYEQSTLDPRSASRTPSAAAEPPYKTRYESPMFACTLLTFILKS